MTASPRWWVPTALVAAGAAVALAAPEERTLGDGIRWVYVHVGLVWAGSLALALAAVGGVVLAVTGRPRLEGWVRALWWAGLGAFALGVGFSMVAASVNWGAVALDEPRMAASLRFLAISALIAVAGAWIARPRVTGALAVVTFALLAWDVGGAELVMHPHDPIRRATSVAIQATFGLCFAVAAALTAWLVLALRPLR
jgi:hypothetical protein